MKQFIQTVLAILDRKEKKKLMILTVFEVMISVFDIAFLGFMLVLINYHIKDKAVPVPFFDRFISIHSLWVVFGFSILFGLKNWIGYRLSYSQNHFFFKIASRLSKQNIIHYLTNDYSSFVHINSSVQIRKIGQQPIEFSTYILVNIQQVCSQGMLVVFTVIAILYYHTQLFLLLLVLLLPPIVILAYYIKKRLKNSRSHMKLVSEKTIQYLKEALGGFVESKLFGKQDFFVKRYYGFQSRLNQSIATQRSLQGLPSRTIEVFALVGFFILLIIYRFTTRSIGIELLDIGVFLTASYKIIPGVVKILNSAGQINSYKYILNDLLVQPNPNEKTISLEPIETIRLKEISFRYKECFVLKNFSLQLYPGDFIGISGRSGSGKTTIINLLLGFVEPDSGIIVFNNKEANQLQRQRYWGRISYVKQQSFLINDSLLKNITLSEEVHDTARLAAAIEFCDLKPLISQYPNGLDHFITEDGKNISGGQRQRIILARAIYKDFDLLILDEPFSELDEISEKKMLSKLAELVKEGKVVLMITHSKKGLTLCNKIVSLDAK